MRQVLKIILLLTSLSLMACSDEPRGKWQAIKKVEVIKEKGRLDEIFFFVGVGEICALGDKWHIQKEMRYKEVVCSKGRGWITTSVAFKKMSD